MELMKGLSARVEDHLAIQTGHSAHLRVFPKGLVASPVVIHMVAFPVAAFTEAGVVSVAFTAAVFLVEAEASTVVAEAVDN